MRAVDRSPQRAGNRAVLYLRQSKVREDSESIENQEYLGREYCKQHGYDIVDVHVDRITGRKWDTRPGVKATMDLIELGHADVIVLWKWSRLSRSRLHWAVAADRVLAAGGRIEAVTEPLDTSTAAGRFARGMMTEYAAFQSEQIGEVWRETAARRVRAGKPASGRDRFGYIRDREADTYTPDPATAPLVAELYRRHIAGNGLASVTRWLNEQGSRTRNGHAWQVTSVKRTLDRGFAAGKLYVGGRLLDGAHEPIIDEATWDAYLARRASNTKGPRGSIRMLSGLMRCECGGPMFAVQSTPSHGLYACARKHRGDPTCPYRCSIDRDNAEAFLSEWILALPARRDEIEIARRHSIDQRMSAIEDRAAIARMIQRAEARLVTLTMKLLDDGVAQTAYDLSAAKLNADISALRARYVRAAPKPAEDLSERFPQIAEAWPTITPAAQNGAARALIHHITVHPVVRPGPRTWRDRIEIVPRWVQDD